MIPQRSRAAGFFAGYSIWERFMVIVPYDEAGVKSGN
jgi:hypothetical protein